MIQGLRSDLRSLSQLRSWRLDPNASVDAIVNRHTYGEGYPDPRIDAVRQLNPNAMRVLEFGCLEGYHTYALASMCQEVVALEVRPENVISSLIRLNLAKVENAEVVLADVRELGLEFGTFDVLYHTGVLYHLSNPVEHLFAISKLGDRLVLDTHYCEDDTEMPRSDIQYNGKTYRAHIHKEGSWKDTGAGVEHYSLWLHKDALIGLLKELGYTEIRQLCHNKFPVGDRMGLYAQRPNPKPGKAPAGTQTSDISLHNLKAAWHLADCLDEKIVECDKLKEEVASLKAELAHQKQLSRDLEASVHAVKGSTTWKIGRLAMSPYLAARALSGSKS